jgi:hypothetical protein
VAIRPQDFTENTTFQGRLTQIDWTVSIAFVAKWTVPTGKSIRY